MPYPWATAGTPGPQSFDAATGTFSYHYRVASSIAAPTEIVLPRLAYPHGYRVDVHGARVISLAGAPRLGSHGSARRGDRRSPRHPAPVLERSARRRSQLERPAQYSPALTR